MASVSVDSGHIEATDFLRSVPREKWRSLMNLRKYFLAVNLTHDCSCLVQFVDDAKVMYAELGFASADEMVRNGYELEPAEIRLAVDWLRLNPPPGPLPMETAKELAKQGRSEDAPRDTKGRYLPSKGEPSTFGKNTKAHWLRRMRRDGRADLLDLIAHKEISAKEGARRAGYIKRQRCPHCGHEL